MRYDFDTSIGKLSQQVSRTLGKKIEEEFDNLGINIRAADWSIISMLHKKGKANQRDISKFLGFDKVMIKRRIDHLEKVEFVKREESDVDRRFNFISLTKFGKKNYKQLEKIAENVIANSIEGISQDEIDSCIETLSKIKDNLIQDIK